MPYLKINTNLDLSEETQTELMQKASTLVAGQLGKPESYVMIEVNDGRTMLFAGEAAPLAYLELKSIGLPEDSTTAFSKALCQLMQDTLNIPAKRVYIEFADAERKLWGWNSSTF